MRELVYVHVGIWGDVDFLCICCANDVDVNWRTSREWQVLGCDLGDLGFVENVSLLEEITSFLVDYAIVSCLKSGLRIMTLPQ